MNKHWGKDIKFVIIFYGSKTKMIRLSKLKKELENLGFIIIDINDLSDKNFASKEYQIGKTEFKDLDVHPNARAWEEITPLIVKKLKL